MALTIIGTLTDGTAKGKITDGTTDLGLTSVSGIPTLPVDVKSLVPEQSGTATLTQVASSVTSTSVLPSNANRKGFILYNATTKTIDVAFAATASLTAYTLPLVAGALYVSDTPIYTGPISAIWTAAAPGNMQVTELT